MMSLSLSLSLLLLLAGVPGALPSGPSQQRTRVGHSATIADDSLAHLQPTSRAQPFPPAAAAAWRPVSGNDSRAAKLQRQVDAAIASGAPATIELCGMYNFNRSSLLIVGSTRQLTLRPSPGCEPQLLFSIWRCGDEPTDGPDCALINFNDPTHPPACESPANDSASVSCGART